MYKLLIVDDEQIEREGMAHFIQWDKYDIYSCAAQHGMELMHLGRFKRMCRI